MGKKLSWFKSVKRAFKYSSKEKASDVALKSTDIMPAGNFPLEMSPDVTNIDDEGELISSDGDDGAIAAATAVAAEAAVVAAEAAAKVVRLAEYRKRVSKEERSAILIQSHYRGYLARRARKALKAIVRLQALVRGYNVRKQANMTMRCMRSLVRVQAQVRAHRQHLVQQRMRNYPVKAPCPQHAHGKEVYEDRILHGDQNEYSHVDNDYRNVYWKNLRSMERSNFDIETIRANAERNHEAIVKRERALAYVYACQQQQQQHLQQQQQQQQQHKQQLGWNWLERWMATQQLRSQHREEQPPYDIETQSAEEMSIKTVEMDIIVDSSTSKVSRRPRGDDVECNKIPSYMVATKSARAKATARILGTDKSDRSKGGLQWNSSIKPMKTNNSGGGGGGGVGDSSSSGGAPSTLNNGFDRSPLPKRTSDLRMTTRRPTGYSPDSSGGDDWTPPVAARRWSNYV